MFFSLICQTFWWWGVLRGERRRDERAKPLQTWKRVSRFESINIIATLLTEELDGQEGHNIIMHTVAVETNLDLGFTSSSSEESVCVCVCVSVCVVGGGMRKDDSVQIFESQIRIMKHAWLRWKEFIVWPELRDARWSTREAHAESDESDEGKCLMWALRLLRQEVCRV